MAMRYASAFLLFSLVIFSETSLLANERREVFYSVKKDLLGEYFDVAVYVEKSSVSPPSLHIINVYGESEAGRACVKEEYFILGMKENITHGETFHYCIGFVSEQSLQMGYMHQDEVYSSDRKTFAQIIRLLNEISEGENSKFPNAIAIFEKIIRTSSLVAESKQKLDNRAYWKSGRVSIDGIAIRLSQSENGNYIKSEFIKKFDQEEK